MTGPGVLRDEIGRLYEAHGRVLLGYAWSLLADRGAAEDVVHQVFTRLLRGDISISGSPVAYLCRAVRNGASNHRRARIREVELEPHAQWLEAPGGRRADGRRDREGTAGVAA